MQSSITPEIRNCFESHLAQTIVVDSSSYPAISHISNKIASALEMNRSFLLDSSSFFKPLLNELYNSKFYGRISNQAPLSMTPAELLDKVISILKAPHENPPQLIMHIHQLFILHIYDKIASPESMMQKKELVTKIFNPVLFNQTDPARARIYNCVTEKEDSLIKGLTSTIGLVSPETCPGLQSTESHCSALQDFVLNPHSSWGKRLNDYNLNFAAGNSGHTGSLLLARELYGKFSDSEFRNQYNAGIRGLLIGGGFHTYDEIGAVLATLDSPYQIGKYRECDFPKSLTTTPQYHALTTKFPGIIEFCEVKEMNNKNMSLSSPFSQSLINGVLLGAIKGASNVIGASVSSNQQRAFLMSQVVSHAAYFMWSFAEQMQASPTADYSAAAFEASKESLCLIAASCIKPGLNHLGNKLSECSSKALNKAGKALTYLSSYADFSGYAIKSANIYMSEKPGSNFLNFVAHTSLATMAGSFSQRAVEKGGRCLERLGIFRKKVVPCATPGANQQTAPKFHRT